MLNWWLVSLTIQPGGTWIQPLDLSGTVMPDTVIHEQLNVPGGAYGVAVAYDSVDQVYLAVWHDQRDGTWRIHATLFQPDGTELTPGGFLLYPGSASWPDVIFDGTNFLVAFSNYDYSSAGDIYAVRVAPDGTILNPGPFMVARGWHSAYAVQLAQINGKVLAVWHDYDNGGNWYVQGALMRTDGNVERVFTVGNAARHQEWPAVAADGSRFLVCWMDYRNWRWDIYCNFVDTTGTLSHGVGGFALASAGYPQLYPDVAYNPQVGEYLVVWQSRALGYYQIYGKRILPDGTVLDGSEVRLGRTSSHQYNPGVAAGPDTLFTVLISEDYRNGTAGDAYAFRVDGSLTRVDSPAVALATQPLEEGHWTVHPPVVVDPSGIVFGWGYGPTGNVTPTAAQLVRRSLNLQTDLWGGVRDLDWQSEPQRSIVFARASDRVLAVWSAPDSTGDIQIWGRLYTLGGHPITPVFPISTATGTQQYPQVVYDSISGNFLVVWEDFRNGVDWDIYGARVDTSGTVLDAAGLALVSVSGQQEEPALAVSDTTVPRFFLVWSDNRAGNWNIYGKFFNEFGVPVTGDLNIGVAGNTQEKARVAYAPPEKKFLVLWEDYRNGRWDLFENLVDLAGNTAYGTGGTALYAPAYHNRRPDVVWTGNRFLVAWQDYRSGMWSIYAARVSPTGMLMDATGIAVATGAGNKVSPRLAWLGNHALLIWQDGRNGRNDLYGTLLDAAGQPALLGGELLVSDLGVNGALYTPGDYPNWVASVVPLTDSTFAIGYEQVQGSPYHNRRVAFRMFRDQAPAFAVQAPGAVVFVGDTVVLHWQTRGILERVTVEGSPDGVTWTAFLVDQPNVDSAVVVLPDQPSRTYRFRVTSTGPWQTRAVSPPVVLMRRPVWQYPLAGDTLLIGDTVLLSWQPTGIGGPVQLEVSYDNGQTWTLIRSYVPDTGSFTWVVSGVPTDHARFRVVHQEYDVAQEISGPVVLRSSATLQLLAPNGGDTLYVGDVLTVQWTASGVNQVSLLLTPDSGLTYVTVAPALDASSGSYTWVVADYPTPYGKMRVQSVDQPSLFDESDAFFTILQPAHITAPSAGDTVDGRQPLTVQWQVLRPDLVDSVDVFFSTDDGRTWSQVGSGIPASLGQYSFSIPNQNLDSCRVAIRHHRRGWLIHDESGRFRIRRGTDVAERPVHLELSLRMTSRGTKLLLALPVRDQVSVVIRNVLGRKVWERTWKFGPGHHRVDLPKLPKGVYFLTVQGTTFRRRVRWTRF